MLKFKISLLISIFSIGLAAQNTGLLWKIEKKGYKSSYLFGTIHIQTKSVFSFDSTVYLSIKKCDQFKAELNFDQAIYMTLARDMPMPYGLTLDSLYTNKQQLDTVVSFLKGTIGPQAEMMKSIKPMYIGMFLAQKSLPKDMPEALDKHLFDYAKSENKTVGGIETVQEQIDAFNSVTLKEQAEELLDMARKYDNTELKQEMQKLTKAYIEQDLKLLDELINEDTTEDDTFTQKVLIDRNYTMQKRISADILKTKSFFAVGAGHLGGKEGLINLLRKTGFTVTHIPFSFQVNKN